MQSIPGTENKWNKHPVREEGSCLWSSQRWSLLVILGKCPLRKRSFQSTLLLYPPLMWSNYHYQLFSWFLRFTSYLLSLFEYKLYGIQTILSSLSAGIVAPNVILVHMNNQCIIVGINKPEEYEKQSKFICDVQNLLDPTICSNLQFNTRIPYAWF